MESVVISVRLPKKVALELKKRKRNVSEAVREIVIKEIERERKELINELRRIKVRRGEVKADVVELIREDRDASH